MFSLFLAMCAFSFAMSISPGPVNLVIISSGINFGFKKTIPFVSGATMGFTLLLLFIGLWFNQFLTRYPIFLRYLTILGAVFIVYMGYKVASSHSSIATESKRGKVPRFFEGFLMQWLNPKAWIACVAGVALFSREDNVMQFLYFVLCYFTICYASLAFWGATAQRATVFLNTKNRMRAFNIIMGSLLVITALYLTSSQFLFGH